MTTHHTPRQRAWRCAAIALAAVASACGRDEPSAPQFQDPRELLWAVRLDHHAIALAASGEQSSIRLNPVAVNAAGEPLADALLTYALSDSAALAIDGEGLLRALQPATGVQVIATASVGNVTRKDTAYVNVVDLTAPPVLSDFSLALASGSNAIPALLFLGAPGVDQAIVSAADADGNPLDGLPVHFTSSDRTTLTIDPPTGIAQAIRPGTVTVTATTTAFGVTKQASATIRVTPPLFATVLVVETSPIGSTAPVLVFQPSEITVSAGAEIFFVNLSTTTPTDVVFDAPANVAESQIFPSGGGNIPPFFQESPENPGFHFRAFPVPGTYTFHSTRFDTNARIIVE